jgi:hypothetical protein
MLLVNEASDSIILGYKDVVGLDVGMAKDRKVEFRTRWYEMRSHMQVPFQ